ncbi:hypothetical protein IU449_10905 [Nocardia higoensis]|uniref:Uncharacterized protein n=1 Tax=Nocardia higoensis TaxID=228599 RepID=A0ABS0D9H0_9NOCA|nr:hypothetical protein [Nocardia higoensis]MBF6355046.1 hypothetical protein [Nocardia higoensis]
MKLRKRDLIFAKPRRSTAVLALVWIGIFVLYLFVKPEQQAGTTILPLSGLLPASITQSEPAQAEPAN